jgi:DNA polymerase III subunit beta
MKFSCTTPELLGTIQLAGRAIGSQQALPILGNVLIKVTSGKCVMTATDLEMSIVSAIPAAIESEGSFTVPAKAFLNFLQYNNDPEITLELVDGAKLRCSSARAKAMIAGEAATEFPSIAAIERLSTFSLDAVPLLQALHLVTFATAKTTLRPVLSGVYVRMSEGRLILAATDSYRLSEYKLPTDGGAGDITCIIPAKILDEVRSALAGSKGEKDAPTRVEIALSKQQVEMCVGETRLISRLIEGRFPNYEQIVPKEHTTRLRFPLAELSPAVKRLHYFAKEMNNTLAFHVTQGQARIVTPQTQAGRDEATVAAETDGADAKIALSSSYLLDFLNHVDTEDVEMRMTDAQHPAIFSAPGDVQAMHLIMPLRMQEE